MSRAFACTLRAIAFGLTLFAAAAAQAEDDTDPAELGRQLLVMLQADAGPLRQPAARQQLAHHLARAHGLRIEYRWSMPMLGIECFVMRARGGPEAVARAVAQLSRDRRIAWAEPMNVYRAHGSVPSHDDPLFAVQPTAAAWQLAELHQRVTGRGVRVAVIDSAVDAKHPDLAGQLAWRENFVDGHTAAAEQHGTAVAGLIAARADNASGIVGIAPQARVLALRACWEQAADMTLCSGLTLAKALQFAIDHGAQAINLSLAGPPSRLLGALLDAALARGLVVVCAFDAARADGGFPASHPGVVAVGEPGGGGLGAPSRDLPVPLPGGRWGFVSGASYAAAEVSGLVALLIELGAASPAKALLRAPGGAVDACASVQAAAGDCVCGCGAIEHR